MNYLHVDHDLLHVKYFMVIQSFKNKLLYKVITKNRFADVILQIACT